jgi:plastocyanin
VTRDNGSPAFTDHNVVENAGFVFGPITFNTPNTYTYHCLVHVNVGMTGSIVVR